MNSEIIDRSQDVAKWKRALWFSLLLTPAVAALIYNQKHFWNYTCDDALISFRYARNLLQGNGFVYNIGERVEGYSNFLWTLVNALTFAVTTRPILVTKVLGLMTVVGSMAYAGLILRMISRERIYAVAALALVLALNTGLGYYSTSGLETTAFGFFIVAGAYHGIRRKVAPFHFPLAVGYFLCAALCRPEGILLLFFATGFRFLEWGLKGNKLSRNEWITLVAAFSIFGAVELFRLFYYHDLVPNTFYAKPRNWMKDKEIPWGGLEYIHGFAMENGGYIMLAFGLILWIRRKLHRRMLYLFGIFGCGLTFTIYANVDWMLHYRFMLPYLPLLLAIGIGGFFDLAGKYSKHWLPIALVLLMTAATVQTQGKSATLFDTRPEFYPYRVMGSQRLGNLGLLLKQKYGSGHSIATKRIGAIGYYSGMQMVDIYGLVDKRIAKIYHEIEDKRTRQKTMIRHVIDRNPDMLVAFTSSRPKYPDSITEKEYGRFMLPDRYLAMAAKNKGYRYLTRYRTGRREWGYVFSHPDFVPIPEK